MDEKPSAAMPPSVHFKAYGVGSQKLAVWVAFGVLIHGLHMQNWTFLKPPPPAFNKTSTAVPPLGVGMAVKQFLAIAQNCPHFGFRSKSRWDVGVLRGQNAVHKFL